MSDILPHSISLDEENNWYAIRLAQCYRPHTPIPSRMELMETKYELEGHCSIKELTSQLGLDYNQEVKKRR